MRLQNLLVTALGIGALAVAASGIIVNSKPSNEKIHAIASGIWNGTQLPIRFGYSAARDFINLGRQEGLYGEESLKNFRLQEDYYQWGQNSLEAIAPQQRKAYVYAFCSTVCTVGLVQAPIGGTMALGGLLLYIPAHIEGCVERGIKQVLK